MAASASKVIQGEGRHVLVVGMGLTGYSIVRHLSEQGVGVCVADTRDFPPYLKQIREEFPAIEIITGRIPYDRIGTFDEVVVSPGIELDVTASETPIFPVGDIELFGRQATAPVIAITGSNGKSTVTMLVTEMLKAAGYSVETGGNIGTPALDLLSRPIPDYYVLELSSFQLEVTHTLVIAAATVLNISEDHMDRYQGLPDYVAAKARIYAHASCAVVNIDDPASPAAPEGLPVISFTMGPPASPKDFGVVSAQGERSMVRGNQVLGKVGDMALQGDQNVANMLAAMALLDAAGISLSEDTIRAGLNFGGLPHRCEVVTEVSGVKWINDSKGTNVGATVAAISGISAPIVLIAGGKGKGANFSLLAKAISSSVRLTILFGEDADVIAETLSPQDSCLIVASLEDAIAEADKSSQPGGVVLFSPACASFDMFDNYEHRGNVFKQLVLERVH